jgi:Uma2 family endonuclease
MATTRRTSAEREVEYPTSDGRPMAETQLHAQEMIDLIETLQDHFAVDPDVYVWGNLLLFYEEGNPRRHVSPDVFIVRGVPKLPLRDHYLIWKEGKGPDLVVEITSKTTRREDQKKKLILYRDVLKVPEYFQFDPTEDYLSPPLQGHRLVAGEFLPIVATSGRLPSNVLELHLERRGSELRLYDPTAGRCLPTRRERAEEAETARQREAEARLREAEARQRTEVENARLRERVEELERKLAGGA